MIHDTTELRGRILAIEMSADVRALYQTVLAEEGYGAVTLDCEEADVEIIAGARPDVIVLDCFLACPRNGWSLLELLGVDPRLREVPVVICTTDTRLVQEDGERLRGEGYGVVQKPFDLDDLLSTIERVRLTSHVGGQD
jgi:CheY-like chemotaxis protein